MDNILQKGVQINVKMIFELGLPRKIFTNEKDAIRFVNVYNGKKGALFKTVYKFEKMNGLKADYNSAIIDKLFFDFDGENGYEEAKKLHNYLLEENIKHYIIMSGRGYHIFIKTVPYIPQNSKSTIYNSQHYFIDKLKLKCDTQVVGDNARLHRIPNTYNQRGERFCIPLTKEQFYSGDKIIKIAAIKQNFINNINVGEKLFDCKPFDYKQDKIEVLEIKDCFESSLNADYLNQCDDKIKSLLLKKDLGWKERFLVILYFKEKGFTEKEVYKILEDNLTPQKFRHCIVDERQLQYLFERDDLFFPENYGIKLYKN